MISSCAKSHVSLPCQCTLWSSLYTNTYSQVYTYIYIYRYSCTWTHAVQTHICLCPLRVLTHWTFLCTSTFSEVYIYHIQDSFVYEPILCKLTYDLMFVTLRALTLRTSLYTSIYSQEHISYYRNFCIWLRVVRTHICLCPCECSHLEPLCIHTFTHKHTNIISQILLYINPCSANSHMPLPWKVLKLWSPVSIRTYIDKKTHIMS